MIIDERSGTNSVSELTPTVSIVMPTLNSSKTIDKALSSIRKQSYAQEKIEILVVDGGSNDGTISIAKKYGAKVILNPRVQPECAKHEGLLHAKGKYAMFLDSDEVLENIDAIKIRVNILLHDPEIRFVLTGGYRKPPGASSVNDYINLFSDPFSYFMHRTSSDFRFYYDSMAAAYHGTSTQKGWAKITFKDTEPLPLVDISAGNTIDLEYLRNNWASIIHDVTIVPRVFSLIARETKSAAILNNDYVCHYCADSFSKYFRKLRWRVVVNMHYAKAAGVGYSNREVHQPTSFKIKKFLFIPYALSVIAPCIDGIYVAITKRSIVALMHPVFSLYVALQIVAQYARKLLRIPPVLVKYG